MTYSEQFDSLVQEHFDISDKATRQCIVALEDSEQTQLLTALSSALYDNIVNKVDKIDFGTIPNSRGDITKVEGFENTVNCLNIMRQLVMEYKENPAIVDTVLAAIENIKVRKGTFMKAYSLKLEFPMILYNLITLSIEQSVSFLISVCIQYIKDPDSNNVMSALDKVAYNNTRDNLLYEQLASFNEFCSNGQLDLLIKDIMKNGGKLAEDAGIDDTGAGVNQIVINVGKDISSDKEICVKKNDCPEPKCEKPEGEGVDCSESPLANDEPELPAAGGDNVPSGDIINSVPNNDNPDMVQVNGCTDNDHLNEAVPIPVIVGAITAGTALALKGVSFLIKAAIPLIRNVVYFAINSRVKFSDYLATQAQFLEINAYKLDYSTTSNLDDDKKAKVVAKQLKIAEKLKAMSNKLAIDNKKASVDGIKMSKDDIKKIKIDDLGDELPPEIQSKSILF